MPVIPRSETMISWFGEGHGILRAFGFQRVKWNLTLERSAMNLWEKLGSSSNCLPAESGVGKDQGLEA